MIINEPDYRLSEYELKRLERIRKNEAYLESLGLSNVKAKLMQQTTQKTKRNQKKAKSSPHIKPREERRSGRFQNGSSGDSKVLMLSYANSDDRLEIAVQQGAKNKRLAKSAGFPSSVGGTEPEDGRPSASFRATRRFALEAYQDYALTEDEKDKLATMDSNYLEKFQEFLVYHNKISDQNVRNVMRQVTKLATGEGVRYESSQYGWKPHQVFQKGVNVTPLSDFVELMKLAQEAEDEWGRDHGNGWLLSHPLKKMLLFQQFCLQNPDFLTSKCRLKEYYAMDDEDEDNDDDDEDPPDEPTKQDEGDDKDEPTPSNGRNIATKRSVKVAKQTPSSRKKQRKGSSSPSELVGRRICQDI